jgi:hypothetical protein
MLTATMIINNKINDATTAEAALKALFSACGSRMSMVARQDLRNEFLNNGGMSDYTVLKNIVAREAKRYGVEKQVANAL